MLTDRRNTSLETQAQPEILKMILTGAAQYSSCTLPTNCTLLAVAVVNYWQLLFCVQIADQAQCTADVCGCSHSCQQTGENSTCLWHMCCLRGLGVSCGRHCEEWHRRLQFWTLKPSCNLDSSLRLSKDAESGLASGKSRLPIPPEFFLQLTVTAGKTLPFWLRNQLDWAWLIGMDHELVEWVYCEYGVKIPALSIVGVLEDRL